MFGTIRSYGIEVTIEHTTAALAQCSSDPDWQELAAALRKQQPALTYDGAAWAAIRVLKWRTQMK